jgi:hypothetical protein
VTVADLVETLKKFPPHLIVTHVGGENGRMPVLKVAVESDYIFSEIKLVELS